MKGQGWAAVRCRASRHTLQGSIPLWPHTAGHSPHAAGPGVAAAVSVPRCGQVRPISATASWAGLNGPEAKTSRSRQISNPV